MFLREASINFSEQNIRGELNNMSANLPIEGTAVVYYQHDVEHKLAEIRHSGTASISSYHHNCLPNSHTCVDIMQVSGSAGSIKEMVSDLRNINHVDRVVFVIAPERDDGCC
jgi:metal-responsive CopG/Arc/MetJ family transcriptional regulator